MFKRYKNGSEEGDTAVAEQEKVTPLGPQRRSYQFGEDPTTPRHPYTTPPSNEPLPRIFESRATGPVGSRAAATPMEQPTDRMTDTNDLFNDESWDTPTEKHESTLETELPETTLGEGVVFKGELSFQRLLRIDGQFEGELSSEGKLVLGPKGVIKSPGITLREAIIEGRVEGNLTIAERIELRGDAVVHGNIEAQAISVDEGVSIVGNVNVAPRTTTRPESVEE